MPTEYGTFRCRICGREGFAPFPDGDDVFGERDSIELTCANAHTDLYDVTVIQRIAANPHGKILSKEAYAGAI